MYKYEIMYKVIVRISINVRQVEQNRNFRLHALVEVVERTEYTRRRSVTRRLELAPGKYFLVPSTREPGQTANFMLRVATTARLEGFKCATRVRLRHPQKPSKPCLSSPEIHAHSYSTRTVQYTAHTYALST